MTEMQDSETTTPKNEPVQDEQKQQQHKEKQVEIHVGSVSDVAHALPHQQSPLPADVETSDNAPQPSIVNSDTLVYMHSHCDEKQGGGVVSMVNQLYGGGVLCESSNVVVCVDIASFATDVSKPVTFQETLQACDGNKPLKLCYVFNVLKSRSRAGHIPETQRRVRVVTDEDTNVAVVCDNHENGVNEEEEVNEQAVNGGEGGEEATKTANDEEGGGDVQVVAKKKRKRASSSSSHSRSTANKSKYICEAVTTPFGRMSYTSIGVYCSDPNAARRCVCTSLFADNIIDVSQSQSTLRTVTETLALKFHIPNRLIVGSALTNFVPPVGWGYVGFTGNDTVEYCLDRMNVTPHNRCGTMKMSAWITRNRSRLEELTAMGRIMRTYLNVFEVDAASDFYAKYSVLSNNNWPDPTSPAYSQLDHHAILQQLFAAIRQRTIQEESTYAHAYEKADKLHADGDGGVEEGEGGGGDDVDLAKHFTKAEQRALRRIYNAKNCITKRIRRGYNAPLVLISKKKNTKTNGNMPPPHPRKGARSKKNANDATALLSKSPIQTPIRITETLENFLTHECQQTVEDHKFPRTEYLKKVNGYITANNLRADYNGKHTYILVNDALSKIMSLPEKNENSVVSEDGTFFYEEGKNGPKFVVWPNGENGATPGVPKIILHQFYLAKCTESTCFVKTPKTVEAESPATVVAE